MDTILHSFQACYVHENLRCENTWQQLQQRFLHFKKRSVNIFNIFNMFQQMLKTMLGIVACTPTAPWAGSTWKNLKTLGQARMDWPNVSRHQQLCAFCQRALEWHQVATAGLIRYVYSASNAQGNRCWSQDLDTIFTITFPANATVGKFAKQIVCQAATRAWAAPFQPRSPPLWSQLQRHLVQSQKRTGKGNWQQEGLVTNGD